MIYENKRILSWKQKFDGDIDNDESINYDIPQPQPPLITNTDSDLTHALTIRVKLTAMHQYPPRMMRAA